MKSESLGRPALPRTTRQVGAWIENEFGVVYEGRSGLDRLLHRLGLAYHKPNVIPRKLRRRKAKAFIEGYEKLLNSMGDDEAMLFAGRRASPTHAARPVRAAGRRDREGFAIERRVGVTHQHSRRDRPGARGQTRMIEALDHRRRLDDRLLQSSFGRAHHDAGAHPCFQTRQRAHHHAKLVQEWLAQPGRRIGSCRTSSRPYCAATSNPIERLWGLMHRNVTHNKCYATCAQFADATLKFPA